jgi:hypothetical protein
MSDKNVPRPGGEIVLYQPREGSGQIRVLLEGQTVWLPQRLIAELFGISVKTVNEHLQNIYEEGELDHRATIRKHRIVQTDAMYFRKESAFSEDIDYDENGCGCMATRVECFPEEQVRVEAIASQMRLAGRLRGN